MEFGQDIVTMYPDETYLVDAQIRNDTSNEKRSLQWTSSNTAVAEVNSDRNYYSKRQWLGSYFSIALKRAVRRQHYCSC